MGVVAVGGGDGGSVLTSLRAEGTTDTATDAGSTSVEIVTGDEIPCAVMTAGAGALPPRSRSKSPELLAGRAKAGTKETSALVTVAGAEVAGRLDFFAVVGRDVVVVPSGFFGGLRSAGMTTNSVLLCKFALETGRDVPERRSSTNRRDEWDEEDPRPMARDV